MSSGVVSGGAWPGCCDDLRRVSILPQVCSVVRADDAPQLAWVVSFDPWTAFRREPTVVMAAAAPATRA